MRRVSWNEGTDEVLAKIARSRLAWGVWVEMRQSCIKPPSVLSRLAWGVWVEIASAKRVFLISSVTPRMRRVSWNSLLIFIISVLQSRLAWGVWVEMLLQSIFREMNMSRLAWGVWVEMPILRGFMSKPESRLAWGVWVEMMFPTASAQSCYVSRLAWGVWVEMKTRVHCFQHPRVTPRMRRVSWNTCSGRCFFHALSHASHEACELKWYGGLWFYCSEQSRLAWGVWVEITPKNLDISSLMSRLAWGVWVEITSKAIARTCDDVTPRMRRVSWNIEVVPDEVKSPSHASHEACELKWKCGFWHWCGYCHASHEACELKYYRQRTQTVTDLVTPRMRRVSWN